MLSFSTCWNNSRHSEGEEMIDEILDLGFNTMELSHGMTISKLPGIQNAYRAGKFRCSGVHNYFPSPVEVMIDAPDCYEYTDDRKDERERAIKLTIKTIEFAEKFNAKYVVLHMGSIPMKRISRDLTKLVAAGDLNSRKFVRLKHKLIRIREKRSPDYLPRARAALDELIPHAEAKGITLAVESRSSYEDVPSEREMITLQEHFKNPHKGDPHQGAGYNSIRHRDIKGFQGSSEGSFDPRPGIH